MKNVRLNKMDWVIAGIFLAISALAFVAFGAPDLVAWGSYLVIPYVILHPAPTIFLYALVFVIAWFTVGRIHRLLGLVGGIAAMYAVGHVLPARVNAAIEAKDRAELPPALALAQTIAPEGTIAIIQEHDRDFTDGNLAVACSALCENLLYSGSVPAVIMARHPERGERPLTPRIWRLERRDHPCERPRSARDHLGLRAIPIEAHRRIQSRAMAGECVTGAPARLTDASLIIDQRWADEPPWSVGESLALTPPRTGQVVTLSRGLQAGKTEVLARIVKAADRKLGTPLRLAIAGSPNSAAYWEWSRPVSEEAHVPPAIDRWLKLKTATLADVDPDMLRRSIDRWLADKTLAADQLGRDMLEQYFRMIEDHGNRAKDIDRVETILRDPRTKSAGFLWMAKQRFPDRAPQYRDLILDRIAELPPGDHNIASLDGTLGTLPESVFKPLPPKLLKLMRDPERRSQMRVGIARLGEAGPSAAPLLFAIVDEGLAQKPEPDTVQALAAISGLCRFAPQIAPAFARLEKIIGSHPEAAERLRYHGYWLVAVTRVRLGRPPSTIANPIPSNASRPRWPENLRDDAAKGECMIS